MTKNSIKNTESTTVPPKGLVPFRKFAAALTNFSDFEAFRDSLSRIVMEDSGYAGILELNASLDSIADAESEEFFTMDSLVVPLGSKEEKGFIRYMGDVKGRPFGAEDLMWIGAITEFVSQAYASARAHHRALETSRVFQYLINQLPLGIVCYGSNKELLAENSAATRLLDGERSNLLLDVLEEDALKKNGSIQFHIEANNKLLYAEGRRLPVNDGSSVNAFVLYDMSEECEKLLLQLERAAYRTESRGSKLTVAVFQDRSKPGRLYRTLKESTDFLQHSSNTLQPLDAYTCACIFEGKSLGRVRRLIRNDLPAKLARNDKVKLALVSRGQLQGLDSPADSLLESGRSDLSPIGEVLRPAILVVDPYEGVVDALSVIVSEQFGLRAASVLEEAQDAIRSEKYDALFLDLDSYPQESLRDIVASAVASGDDFRIYYVSHLPPGLVRSKYCLNTDSTVLQKPFNAEDISGLLAQQFNFA